MTAAAENYPVYPVQPGDVIARLLARCWWCACITSQVRCPTCGHSVAQPITLSTLAPARAWHVFGEHERWPLGKTTLKPASAFCESIGLHSGDIRLSRVAQESIHIEYVARLECVVLAPNLHDAATREFPYILHLPDEVTPAATLAEVVREVGHLCIAGMWPLEEGLWIDGEELVLAAHEIFGTCDGCGAWPGQVHEGNCRHAAGVDHSLASYQGRWDLPKCISIFVAVAELLAALEALVGPDHGDAALALVEWKKETGEFRRRLAGIDESIDCELRRFAALEVADRSRVGQRLNAEQLLRERRS